MKQLTVIGLATLAIAAVMALVGASSASAETSLCKIKTSAKCEGANLYPIGTVLTFATANMPTFAARQPAKLVTNLGTIQCDSSVSGKTSEATSAVILEGEITSLTFTSCKLGPEFCTIGESANGKAKNLPYKSTILTEGFEGNGSLETRPHPGGENPGVFVKCGSIMNCTFSTLAARLSLTGGAAMVAVAEANAISLSTAGGTCPTTARWTAKYFLETPTPVFVGM